MRKSNCRHCWSKILYFVKIMMKILGENYIFKAIFAMQGNIILNTTIFTSFVYNEFCFEEFSQSKEYLA